MPGATVALDNSSIIGITNADGWANESAVSVFNRTATVEATDDNYSTAWRFVYLGYTGEVDSSLELLKAGLFTVVVLDERSGDPIGGAHGLVTHLDPGLPAPFGFTTNASGKFVRLLVAGNYSVAAWAAGYLNGTTATGQIKWVTNLTLTLKLTPDDGTNVSVRLVDSQTGEPIAFGTVSFGDVRVAHTNAHGWANVTDLLPPGAMRVVGAASGYRSNNTTIVLRYNAVLPPVVMKLECLACLAGGSGGNGGLAASPFLPTSGAGLLLLLIAPALLAIGGAIYVIAATARRRQSEGEDRRRPARVPAMSEVEGP